MAREAEDFELETLKEQKNHDQLDGGTFSKNEENEEDKPEKLMKWTKADVNIKEKFGQRERYIPTNAVGTFQLQEETQHTHNPSEYVRVRVGSHEKDKIENILEFIEKDWQLSKPKLLLSVIGGELELKEEDKEYYANGIVGVATSEGAWIVTGGTNVNMIRSIGETVKKQYDENGTSTVVLGIAGWKEINSTLREQLTLKSDMKIRPKKGKKKGIVSPSDFLPTIEIDDENIAKSTDGVKLEYNHSHFLLIDSGLNGDDEVTFRGHLENLIAKVHMDKKQRRNSKWAGADFSTNVVYIVIGGGLETIHMASEAIKNGFPVIVIANTGGAADLIAQFKEKKEIRRSDPDTLQKYKITATEEDLKKAVDDIISCLDKTILTVYERQSESEITDVVKIVSAEAKTNKQEILTMALELNRVDLLDKTNTNLSQSDIQNNDSGESDALRYALVNNRSDFLEMIMENVDIKKYLDEKELEYLYNAEPEHDTLLQQLLKETTKQDSEYKVEHIEKLIEKLTDYAFGMSCKKLIATNHGCMQVLLIYAVLRNFPEMVKYFWENCRGAVSSALAVSKLYKSMAALHIQDVNQRKSWLESAKEYERLACDTLAVCYEEHKEETAKILQLVVEDWGDVTCLNLAEAAGSITFLSQPAVLYALDNKWQGYLMRQELIRSGLGHFKEPITLMLCSVFPCLIPFMVRFQRDMRDEHWFSKITTFFDSPRSKFRHNFVSYIVFVLLFSYNLLWESNERNSWSAWLLFMWVFSMTTEEIRQMLEMEANTFCLRIKNWWSENWNKFDVFAITLYFVGMSLRRSPNERAIEASRFILAFDIFIFYLRTLEYLTFIKTIGPKVLMIGKMVIDLLFFMCIAFIFLVGYGIASHIILYPYVTQPSAVFESILYRPYFQIYGELFLEELRASPDDGSCSFDKKSIQDGAQSCAEYSTAGVVFLGMYLLFSNVLLLNLLIAMFSNTYNAVQDKTDLHWRFQRYKLKKEFLNKPGLVPPLSILVHLVHLSFFVYLAIRGRSKRYLPLMHQYGLRREYGHDNKHPKQVAERLLLWDKAKAKKFRKRGQVKDKQRLKSQLVNACEEVMTMLV